MEQAKPQITNSTISKRPIHLRTPWLLPDNMEGIHSGVDIEVEGVVLSCCAGVVTMVGKDWEKRLCVCVEYDAGTLVRYMHLKSTDLTLGQAIRGGDIIGLPDQYVHIELCKVDTAAVGKYRFPVRVGARTYDKFDPTDIITGATKLLQGDELDVPVDGVELKGAVDA